jgi:hypothetical protein
MLLNVAGYSDLADRAVYEGAGSCLASANSTDCREPAIVDEEAKNNA